MKSLLVVLFISATATIVLSRPQSYGGFGLRPPPPPLIPPGFEEHLPQDAKDKLIALHFDKDLSYEQRRDKIEQVFDELPRDVLEKLPLPPGLERLPEESKAKFRELHLDRTLDWRQRHQLVQEAIQKLPEDQQRLVAPPRSPMPAPMLGQGFQVGSNQLGNGFVPPPPPMPAHFAGPMGFPPHPPPGFERVLAPTIYRQLMAVHQNNDLSVPEKKQQIDRIMLAVPQEQLERLPLPPGFDRLPAERQQRVRALMHDFKLDWEQRHQRVKEFIKTLPTEERRLLRPPTPPGFEALPDETQDQIDDLFLDEKLSPPERFAKIHEIIQKLPSEIRSKLPPPPPFFPAQPLKSNESPVQEPQPTENNQEQQQ